MKQLDSNQRRIAALMQTKGHTHRAPHRLVTPKSSHVAEAFVVGATFRIMGVKPRHIH